MTLFFGLLKLLSCHYHWKTLLMFTLVCNLAVSYENFNFSVYSRSRASHDVSSCWSSQLNQVGGFHSIFGAATPGGPLLVWSTLKAGWAVTTAVLILAEFSLPFFSRLVILPVVVKRFERQLHGESRLLAARQGGFWLVLSIRTSRLWLVEVFTCFYSSYRWGIIFGPLSEHMIYWLLSECKDHLKQHNKRWIWIKFPSLPLIFIMQW